MRVGKVSHVGLEGAGFEGLGENTDGPSLVGIALLDLPDDSLQGIVRQLRPDSHLAVALVCRRFRRVLDAYVVPFNFGGTKRRYWTPLQSLTHSFERLEWAVTCCHAPLCPALSEAAAADGRIDCLQWLRTMGCPWNSATSAMAAQRGHLQLLQWAHENGCPWDTQTTTMAAGAGQLEILQWVRTKGCPWDEFTCAAAAAGGHLSAMKWAKINGCPWDRTLVLSLCQARTDALTRAILRE